MARVILLLNVHVLFTLTISRTLVSVALLRCWFHYCALFSLALLGFLFVTSFLLEELYIHHLSKLQYVLLLVLLFYFSFACACVHLLKQKLCMPLILPSCLRDVFSLARPSCPTVRIASVAPDAIVA